MSHQDSKLIATAVGAAAAGAALAVIAMKMAEKKEEPLKPIYRPRSIMMNEPAESKPSLNRQDSGNLLFPHNHEEKMRRRIATRYQIEDENSSPRESVTVRVPATSANVGPGCT